jgi:cell division protein FtsA
LKTRFGRAIAEEASPNEVVSIPGIRNRTAKEISVKNLSSIIQARMEEIIEMCHVEIINSGYENRLAGGIVITGGGAQLSNLKQLVEYMTGMDARIGYPNEHLGRSKQEIVKSPMYATAVGLVLAGFRSLDERDQRRITESKETKVVKQVAKVKKSLTSDFFTNILNKTKGLLIDDLDGKNEY